MAQLLEILQRQEEKEVIPLTFSRPVMSSLMTSPNLTPLATEALFIFVSFIEMIYDLFLS